MSELGKFSGEPKTTEYFWNLSLEGDGETYTFEDGTTLTAVEITKEDVVLFPELPVGTKENPMMYVLEETNDGFVNHEIMTSSRWARMQA